MYLTAQRVRSTDGREGVNSYLFLHLGQTVPGMSWTQPDINRIADQFPGAVVVQRIEHDSGGNDVLSFLDIASDDKLGPDLIKAAIGTTPRALSQSATWTVGGVAFRFFRANANHRENQLEYESLRAHALFLLKPRRVREAIDAGRAKLQILIEDQEGLGVVYRMPDESQQRVRTINPDYVPASLKVAYEDRASLVSLWGRDAYHDQIALGVTGLSPEALNRTGGVEFSDVRHQLSPSIVATSEELDGQLVGDWFGPDDKIEPRTTWPTGGLLVAGSLALDLVYIERAWYPLSEAALYTYSHTQGLQRREPWQFVTRGEPRRVFSVELGPLVSREQVRVLYGDDAANRSRPDRKTVQLQLKEISDR